MARANTIPISSQLPGGGQIDIAGPSLAQLTMPQAVGRPISAMPSAFARTQGALGAEQMGLAGLAQGLTPSHQERWGGQILMESPLAAPGLAETIGLAAGSAAANPWQLQGLGAVSDMSTVSPWQNLAALNAMQAGGAPLLPAEWGQAIEPGLADTYLQGQQELMSGLKSAEDQRMADVTSAMHQQATGAYDIGRQDLLNRMAQQYGPQAFTSGMGFEMERRLAEAMQRNVFQSLSQTGLEGQRQLAGMQQQGLLQTLGQLPGQLAQGRQAAALQQLGTRLPAAQLMGQLGGQMWQQPLQQGSALAQLGGMLPQQQLAAAQAAAPMASQLWQQPIALAQSLRQYGGGNRQLEAGIAGQLLGGGISAQQQQMRAAQAMAAQAEQTRQIEDLARQRAFEEWRQRQQLFSIEPWKRLTEMATLFRPTTTAPTFQPSTFAQMAPSLAPAIAQIAPAVAGAFGGGQGNTSSIPGADIDASLNPPWRDPNR